MKKEFISLLFGVTGLLFFTACNSTVEGTSKTLCTYVFDANGGKWNDGDIKKSLTGRTGDNVIVIENPTKFENHIEYEFVNWDKSVPFVFGDEDLIFTAQWQFKFNNCIVLHYKQPDIHTTNRDDYILVEEDTENIKVDYVMLCNDDVDLSWQKTYEVYIFEDCCLCAGYECRFYYDILEE